MDSIGSFSKAYSHSNYRNVIRESDILNDSIYKEKKAFYDELKLKTQIHCNSLKENAVKEARSIRDHLIILISQLPSRVQKMTVAEFCEEFGFEVEDGNLLIMDDTNLSSAHRQDAIFKTVQKRREGNYRDFSPIRSSNEVLSELQIVRGSTSQPSLRLIKNSATYDLSTQAMRTISQRERSLIQSEVAAFTKLLNEIMPR